MEDKSGPLNAGCHVLVIGAGPAGLTAGYLLAQQGIQVTVLEADSEYLGGISKTVCYRGFYFDIGGHRFFSKSQEVENLWSEVLPHDLLVRKRSSRIFYGGKFYAYPLRPWEALLNLGVFEAFLCGLSFLKAQLSPKKICHSFEDWVSREFGYRLFSIFFKTYTEKVWGMRCKDISADWAAQRIQGLSLWKAVKHAIWPGSREGVRTGQEVIKTLIDTFRYPRKGPGMMWEAFGEKICQRGGKILRGQRAQGLGWDAVRQKWVVTFQSGVDGQTQEVSADHVVSSMSLRELVDALGPSISTQTQIAANELKYRDFLTVVLIVQDADTFPDNWVYIHDPHVKVGRIQNFKSWSPEMVKDPSYNCYGLEYFCFEGDGLWNQTDAELIEIAKKEVDYIGLFRTSTVIDASVVRQAKAYPVYDHGYAEKVEKIRTELEAKFPTLHMVGRNGMHKYNNQDHAMMTAMLTVKNIVSGKRKYDVWRVNQDAQYHEANTSVSGSLREVPQLKA